MASQNALDYLRTRSLVDCDTLNAEGMSRVVQQFLAMNHWYSTLSTRNTSLTWSTSR